MKDILLKLKACEEAVEWAGDKTAEEIIDTCHRGDWLLWLANKLKVDDRPFTLAKGHCANTFRHLMKDERSIKAVDAAIAYGNGEVSKEELNDTDWSFYGCFFAAYYAYYASAKSNQLETADICRKYLGHLILEKLC